MIEKLERLSLADLPTPLQALPRLAQELGLSELLVKRDDMTGLGMGGNKARKLEYDLFEAKRRGCDVLLTVGGPQSNHARITAAAARRLGMDVKLVLGGPDFTEHQGNLLLDAVLGAEIRFLQDDDDNDSLAAAMRDWGEELSRQGRRPYLLPVGGSTPLGAAGYVRAMKELAGQLGPRRAQVVLAVGSCGTLAGAVLGARLYMPGIRVVGISVSRTRAAIQSRTAELAGECAALLGSDERFAAADIEAHDGYHEAYGVMTASGKDAILAAARLEGLLLDPVYTGKAMAGLMDLARRKVLDPALPTVFFHTGGQPILFSFEKDLRSLAACVKIPKR